MLLEADVGGRDGDGRMLVLLHGMGTTREVWAPLISLLERDWSGRWIAPDLRGHGRSPHARSYALGAHACDVAETLAALSPQSSRVVVLGHSMGGVIALALASGWFGLQPHAALGLGIKIAWSREELDSLAARARAPAKTFKSPDETAAFYLKVSGLAGLVGIDAPTARAGIGADGLRLAADPATAHFGPPPMTGLMAAARAPIHLAAGENDPMSTLADMRAHDPDAKVIEGAGHNAMIEAPERVWAWVKECIA
jgi:pimeloyl-ACP methyl ester carboxylesterase